MNQWMVLDRLDFGCKCKSLFLVRKHKFAKLIKIPIQRQIPIFMILDYRHPQIQKFFTVPILPFLLIEFKIIFIIGLAERKVVNLFIDHCF